MKAILAALPRVLLCLIQLLVGILLLIDPVLFTQGIIICSGVALALLALWSILGYFRANAATAARDQKLFRGLCLLLAALFCMFRAQWFIATFPVLALLYGAVILATGLMRVQWTVDALRLKNGRWLWHAIGAGLALVLSAVILLNPFATTVLWIFAGVSLIAEALVDVITLVLFCKSNKAPKEEA